MRSRNLESPKGPAGALQAAGLWLCLVLLACGLGGCTSSFEETRESGELTRWVGKLVSVQFRRDVLGAAANLPINPLTSSINGAETRVRGTLLQAKEGSLLLEVNGKALWIPREVILLVQGER